MAPPAPGLIKEKTTFSAPLNVVFSLINPLGAARARRQAAPRGGALWAGAAPAARTIGGGTIGPVRDAPDGSTLPAEVVAVATTYGARRSAQPDAPQSAAERWVRWPVAALEAFVALGGLVGGITMLRHPRDAMGMTTGVLEGSPFSTFTWPGVLLLVLNGAVPGLLAVGVLRRTRHALVLSAAWGVGLMAWIAVQWAMVDERLWLQPVLFAIGGVVAATSGLAVRAHLR